MITVGTSIILKQLQSQIVLTLSKKLRLKIVLKGITVLLSTMNNPWVCFLHECILCFQRRNVTGFGLGFEQEYLKMILSVMFRSSRYNDKHIYA